MKLCIKPKAPAFKHAGELSAHFDAFDPRLRSFGAEQMDVDLRDCRFVRPPAVL